VPAGLPGGSRPAAHPLDRQLWLISSLVPLQRYGPEALEHTLKDIDWVSSVALAHEAVVEHFITARGLAVIPLKLFTMFSTMERARQELQGRAADLERVFRRIAGCEEWGVRVLRPEGRPAARTPVPVRTGAAFLAARKKDRDSSTAARTAAAHAAERAYASLAEIARAGRRQAPPSVVGAPLLDAAFLVPSRRRARFHQTAARLAKDVGAIGAQMTLSGPWPPYNFVVEEAG
jgi:hypothetical protein